MCLGTDTCFQALSELFSAQIECLPVTLKHVLEMGWLQADEDSCKAGGSWVRGAACSSSPPEAVENEVEPCLIPRFQASTSPAQGNTPVGCSAIRSPWSYLVPRWGWAALLPRALCMGGSHWDMWLGCAGGTQGKLTAGRPPGDGDVWLGGGLRVAPGQGQSVAGGVQAFPGMLEVSQGWNLRALRNLLESAPIWNLLQDLPSGTNFSFAMD